MSRCLIGVPHPLIKAIQNICVLTVKLAAVSDGVWLACARRCARGTRRREWRCSRAWATASRPGTSPTASSPSSPPSSPRVSSATPSASQMCAPFMDTCCQYSHQKKFLCMHDFLSSLIFGQASSAACTPFMAILLPPRCAPFCLPPFLILSCHHTDLAPACNLAAEGRHLCCMHTSLVKSGSYRRHLWPIQ